jgi:hypothetical protein
MLFVLWLTIRLLTRPLVLPNADDGTKDLEILVLRHQLRVLRRKTGRPRFTAADRVLPAAASRMLPRQRWTSLFVITPQTLLRWHRTLVRRKWTYAKQRTPGRPPIDPQTADLILRMAGENARWGCMRICGELHKLWRGQTPRRARRPHPRVSRSRGRSMMDHDFRAPQGNPPSPHRSSAWSPGYAMSPISAES